jgi:hypothetical protein
MHPWSWLNEPQHGTAVQAVTGVIYTIASLFVGWFAFGTYKAAKEQAQIAREQALAVERHHAEQLQQMLSEKTMREAEARARYLKLASEEDAQRPRWQVLTTVPQRTGSAAAIKVTNVGKTSALKVAYSDDAGGKEAQRDVIEPEYAIIHNLRSGSLEPNEILLAFKSVFGTHWTLRFRNTGSWTEEVIAVDRPYAVVNVEN